MTQPILNIPHSLIVGCWQLDDRSWRSHSESDIFRAIDTYLATGVTTFDTADIYGRSEILLGKVLKGRDCNVFTKSVFFGNTPSSTQIRNKVENSLRNLKRDVLDCVQIHWHDPKLDFSSTFDTFKTLVDEKKIKRISVTNFDTPMLEKVLMHAPIYSNQMQYSLIDRRAERSMVPLCQTNNIAIFAYGVLVGGFLSDGFKGVKSMPSESDHARSFYYSRTVRAHGGWVPLQMLLEKLGAIAQKYEKTTAQVALNWLMYQPGVTAIISGLTLSREKIIQNVEALNWQMEQADLEWLSQQSDGLFEQQGDVYSYERV